MGIRASKKRCRAAPDRARRSEAHRRAVANDLDFSKGRRLVAGRRSRRSERRRALAPSRTKGFSRPLRAVGCCARRFEHHSALDSGASEAPTRASTTARRRSKRLVHPRAMRRRTRNSFDRVRATGRSPLGRSDRLPAMDFAPSGAGGPPGRVEERPSGAFGRQSTRGWQGLGEGRRPGRAEGCGASARVARASVKAQCESADGQRWADARRRAPHLRSCAEREEPAYRRFGNCSRGDAEDHELEGGGGAAPRERFLRSRRRWHCLAKGGGSPANVRTNRRKIAAFVDGTVTAHQPGRRRRWGWACRRPEMPRR